jgi:lysophospholipase L1-like esterase
MTPRCACTLLLLATIGTARAADGAWIATWTAPSDFAAPALAPQTIRQTVRLSAGGNALRLRLSNLFGDQALIVGPVRAGAAEVHFGGAPVVTIAPHALVVSDPVALPVAPLQELPLTLFLPAGASTATIHATGLATTLLAPGTDATGAAQLRGATTDDSRYFVTGVDVLAAPPAQTLVVVGDSLTDGVGSTPDANRRWPDALAERVQARRPGTGVVNAGIAGNRILNSFGADFIGSSTLERFERDALALPGVRWVVFLQGINDIMGADRPRRAQDRVTARQVTTAIATLAARAHARGIAFWAGTLLPRGGSTGPRPHSAAAEAQRQAVNAWLRTTAAVDGVIDFDAALRDPAAPERLLPAYASPDHTHLNDSGYRRMAATVDLDRMLTGPAAVVATERSR